MDKTVANEHVRRVWNAEILPSLSDLVAIPALSPSFDAQWAEHGHLDAAVAHVRGWLEARDLPGASVDVVTLPDRTPVLLLDVPASGEAEGTSSSAPLGTPTIGCPMFSQFRAS